MQVSYIIIGDKNSILYNNRYILYMFFFYIEYISIFLCRDLDQVVREVSLAIESIKISPVC